MDYRAFIDQFSILTEQESHYQRLFEAGKLPEYPPGLRGGVTLGEDLLGGKRDIVVQKHPCFLPEYPHDHEFLEMEAVINGRCSQESYGNHVIMHAGDVLVIAPHTYHTIGVFNASTIVLNIRVRIEAVLPSLEFAKSDGPLGALFDGLRSQSGALGCVLVHGCQDLFPLVSEFSGGDGTIAKIRLAEWFYCLGLQQSESLVPQDEKSRRLSLILSRIRESGGSVSLADLADELHVTPTYLSSLIHQYTGMTFRGIVARERISLACQLLSSNLACKAVAARLHMPPERFNRFFRGMLGISPGRWKTTRHVSCMLIKRGE